jgi:hypothetical protein
MPDAVYVLWWIILILTAPAIPYMVYRLHKASRMAASIERYCNQILEVAEGIKKNTDHIKALRDTVDISDEMSNKIENVNKRAAALEKKLEERVKKHKKV